MLGHERYTNAGGRLVKLMLPSSVVRAMDGFIQSSSTYNDRNEFISDAIQGQLAELEAAIGKADAQALRSSPGIAAGEVGRQTARHMGGGDAGLHSGESVMGEIPPIDYPVPTIAAEQPPSETPTWGMHNRDFPTLWAAARLAAVTGRLQSVVSFEEWHSDVTSAAWDVPRQLDERVYDTSGFPTNPDKPESSESRFVRFFVGTEPGVGPIFTLGLAASRGGEVALTPSALELLEDLEGFSCRTDHEVKREWSERYLAHLVEFAPADFHFMARLIALVDEGVTTRTGLLERVGKDHPEWSDSVCATNVAGYIGRAREWGLMAPKQDRGNYLLTPNATEIVQSTSS